MIHEEIPAALDGERIDRVTALLTGINRADATALVLDGVVEINGQAVTAKAHRLHEGDLITINWEPVMVDTRPTAEPDLDVNIVFVDDEVIVVDKAPGVVVHPGHGQPDHTLVNALLARFPELSDVGDAHRPGIVHRLDKETSGLLMVARSPAVYDDLVAQLAARTVQRRYTALVWGHVENPAGRIEAPIGRSPRDPTLMAVTERGKPAVTDYVVLDTFDEPAPVTLVQCKLHTGRTHQIRVHLRAIGHPVLGDDRYGGRKASVPVPRLFLHAATLGFTHPRTGEPMSFDSPLPADLATVLAGLSTRAD
jgi:23S rRNA pseudouridine1911/1915/1917 synthase